MCLSLLFIHPQFRSALSGLNKRSVVDILQNSLRDHPQVMSVHNEVRYKLIIDPSEDDSLVRLLFEFDVLDRENTHLYLCSDFPGDGNLQEVSMALYLECKVQWCAAVELCTCFII